MILFDSIELFMFVCVMVVFSFLMVLSCLCV